MYTTPVRDQYKATHDLPWTAFRPRDAAATTSTIGIQRWCSAYDVARCCWRFLAASASPAPCGCAMLHGRRCWYCCRCSTQRSDKQPVDQFRRYLLIVAIVAAAAVAVLEYQRLRRPSHSWSPSRRPPSRRSCRQKINKALKYIFYKYNSELSWHFTLNDNLGWRSLISAVSA